MSQTPVAITPGTGAASVAAELIAGTSFQQIEVYGGGGASVLSVNPDGSFKASIIGIPSFTISGSSSISGAVTIVGTPSISGTVNVSGLQGASVSGSLNIVGNPSISGTVAAIQQGAWTTSVVGGPLTMYAPSASLVSAVSSVITGTVQTSVLLTAPGAQRNYVTQILVTNGSANGTFVDIMDGPNVVYSGYAAANGGGFSASFPAPFKQATLAQSLDAKPRAQASIIVAISGYTAA